LSPAGALATCGAAWPGAVPELGVAPHPFLLQRLQRFRFRGPGRGIHPLLRRRYFLLLVRQELAETLGHGISGLEHGLEGGILIGGKRHTWLLKTAVVSAEAGGRTVGVTHCGHNQKAVFILHCTITAVKPNAAPPALTLMAPSAANRP
jgi:hypothetical protein